MASNVSNIVLDTASNIGRATTNAVSNIGQTAKNVGNATVNAATNIGQTTGLVKSSDTTLMFYLKLFGIILVLAFLGLNIFTYLKGGVDAITYFFKKITSPVISPITKGMAPIISPIEKGIKKTVNLAGNTVKEISSSIKKDKINIENEGKLGDDDDEAWKLSKEDEESDEECEPKPDSDVLSEIQNGRKQGWCYIGTDRGYRSCVKIGEMDKCLSGKVYHTEAICHDPNLRA